MLKDEAIEKITELRHQTQQVDDKYHRRKVIMLKLVTRLINAQMY
jgi:hypothetical protein